MGGFGGGWSSAAKFVGVDVGLNAALDHFGGSTEYTPTGTKVTPEGKKKPDVPLIIAPEYREQYLAEQAKKKTEQAQTTEQKPKPSQKVEEDLKLQLRLQHPNPHKRRNRNCHNRLTKADGLACSAPSA